MALMVLTTEEIRTAIERYIAGQGTQVDSGGKLPEILNGILDLIGGGGGGLPAGGTTGQVLAKKSDGDGDVEWIDGGAKLLFKDVEYTPDVPVPIRPIDDSSPASLRIPASLIGVSPEDYELLTVMNFRTARNTTIAPRYGNEIIVSTNFIQATGELNFVLVRPITTPRDIVKATFTAVFIKKTS